MFIVLIHIDESNIWYKLESRKKNLTRLVDYVDQVQFSILFQQRFKVVILEYFSESSRDQTEKVMIWIYTIPGIIFVVCIFGLYIR